MLENIKMLLSLQEEDTTKDAVIEYWINHYSKMILKYCHLDTLSADMDSIIEQMVVARMGGIGSSGNISSDVNDGIKSMTRGDYSVTYKDNIEDTKIFTTLDKFAITFQGQLNLWRRLDY